MKIIEIIYSLSSGGAERFVVDLSNEFVAKGNDVLLCTLLDDKKNNRAFYKFELNQKIEYVNLGYEKLGISCILSIYKLINKYKPDVVHMHLSNDTYFLFVACRIVTNQFFLSDDFAIHKTFKPSDTFIYFFFC